MIKKLAIAFILPLCVLGVCLDGYGQDVRSDLTSRNLRWAAELQDGRSVLVWDLPGERHRHFACILENRICRQLRLRFHTTLRGDTTEYGPVEVGGYEMYDGGEGSIVLVEKAWGGYRDPNPPLVYRWIDQADPTEFTAVHEFWDFYVNKDPRSKKWLVQLDVSLFVPEIEQFLLLQQPATSP